MDVRIITHAHNGVYMGPFPLCSYFIGEGAPDFGSAIQEIRLDAYFKDVANKVGGDPAAAEWGFGFYNQRLSKLPKVRFQRSKRLFSIKYVSEACLGADFVRHWHDWQPGTVITTRFGYRADIFDAFFKELYEVFGMMSQRLKRSDDFDLQAFLKWVQSREPLLPKSDRELNELPAWIEVQDEKRKRQAQQPAETKDPWDLLDIDWKQYHRNARELLNDLFFWDCVDELAPHGNDEGADLLQLFKKWRRKNGPGESKEFFELVLEQWGFTDPTHFLFQQTYDDSIVGLAFAHLKIDGACTRWAREEALKVLDRKIADWDNPLDETGRKLGVMRKKLEECPELNTKET